MIMSSPYRGDEPPTRPKPDKNRRGARLLG